MKTTGVPEVNLYHARGYPHNYVQHPIPQSHVTKPGLVHATGLRNGSLWLFVKDVRFPEMCFKKHVCCVDIGCQHPKAVSARRCLKKVSPNAHFVTQSRITSKSAFLQNSCLAARNPANVTVFGLQPLLHLLMDEPLSRGTDRQRERKTGVHMGCVWIDLSLGSLGFAACAPCFHRCARLHCDLYKVENQRPVAAQRSGSWSAVKKRVCQVKVKYHKATYQYGRKGHKVRLKSL